MQETVKPDTMTRGMMRRRARRMIGVVALLLAGAGTAAAGTLYECDITAHSRSGFVPSKMVIYLSDDFTVAIVNDDYIEHYLGKPMRVDLRQMSAEKYELNWEMDGIKARLGRVSTLSTARLDTRRMRVSYLSYVKGYVNHNRGSGKCTAQKVKY